MSFVKVLARRVLESNVRKLEQPDIWKLFHLVHFYKGLGIKGDQTFRDIPDQKTTLKEQYSIVHKHIQQQVKYTHDACMKWCIAHGISLSLGSKCVHQLVLLRICRYRIR